MTNAHGNLWLAAGVRTPSVHLTKALEDAGHIREKTGFAFGATGARILSQAVKELAAMSSGCRAVVSICADGGQGTVALLEN